MNFIIKGDFAYAKTKDELTTIKDGYLVCVDGISQGVFESIPNEFRYFEVIDYTDKLIIPGMVDLHIHAPQYAFRGMYMDEELMDWLQKYTFNEEAKYQDLGYAKRAYSMFAGEMKKSATTRVSIFGTVHRNATTLLMNEMEETGLVSYVGKVNMDRDAFSEILDESPLMSAYETFGWINGTLGKFQRTHPILTPRFIPCCSDELLGELKEIVHTYDIPVQSHLSENPGEVAFVKQLMPDIDFYGQGYDRYDLFGKPNPTIMAHCVYSEPREVELMKENGVYVAHCPSSNMNLRSGIAPIRKYIDMGLKVGLGSDVAAGESESIFNEIKKAIEVSKMYQRYIDNDAKPLTFAEAFWLATKSGGEFFGQVGSFEKGYEVDLVVLADDREPHPQPLGIAERLERAVYLDMDKRLIACKYVQGKKVYENPIATALDSGVGRDTFTQISTLQGLMKGDYYGSITVDEMLQYGDIGLGTFESLEGEMIILDGVCYQAKGDGSVNRASGETGVPFGIITTLDYKEEYKLPAVSDMSQLVWELDSIIREFGTNNFYVCRIDGMFTKMIVRSETVQQEPYPMLPDVLATSQTEFEYDNVEGSLVCVFCPEYMDGLNAVGWHTHFISSDGTKGGHVFELEFESAHMVLDKTDGFNLKLPDGEYFQQLDLMDVTQEEISAVEK